MGLDVRLDLINVQHFNVTPVTIARRRIPAKLGREQQHGQKRHHDRVTREHLVENIRPDCSYGKYDTACSISTLVCAVFNRLEGAFALIKSFVFNRAF